MKKRIVASILIFIFVLTAMLPLGAGKAEDLQKQLDELDKQKKELSADKAALKKQTKTYETEIRELDNTQNVLVVEIDEVNLRLKNVEGLLVVTNGALNEAIAKANTHRDVLDKRVKVMYQQGKLGYLNVVFSAVSFSDLITRIDMVNKIMASDATLLEEMKQYQTTIEEKKVELEKQKAEVVAFKNTLQVKNTAIDKLIDTKNARVKELLTDLKTLEKFEDKLLAESKSLESQIAALQGGGDYSGGIMAFPFPGEKVGSKFGMRMHPILKYNRMHSGVDIGGKKGNPIVAANDGKVIVATFNKNGYGNYIIIDHGGKISTLYGHNSKLLVKVGDTVKRGETIAYCGSTGLSTGPHLHFEVRVNGKPVDPMKYISKQG